MSAEHNEDSSAEASAGGASSGAGVGALAQVERLAEQVVSREGVRLYDLEMVGGSTQRVLRIYIEREGAPVSIDDCANVSRGLSLLLDVDDVIPGRYELEVSSPGMERKLRKPWHFHGQKGKTVELRLRRPAGELGATHASLLKSKKIKGQIGEEESQDWFLLQTPWEVLRLPFGEIERAQVIFDFEANKGKKKRGS